MKLPKFVSENIAIDWETLEWSNIGCWPWIVQIFLLCANLLLIVMVGYYVFLQPQICSYFEKKELQSSLLKSVTNIRQTMRNVSEIKKENEAFDAQLSSVLEMLPKRPDEAKMLEDLSHISLKNNVVIKSFKPFAEEYKGHYFECALELNLVGNYHNFGIFLSELLSLARLVTVQNFSIKVCESFDELDIKLVLKTYWSDQETLLKSSQEEPMKEGRKRSLHAYKSQMLRNPFQPYITAHVKNHASILESSSLNRSREPLENYPLDALYFMGTIANETHRKALIKDSQGLIHSVVIGNYLGQNSGKIENISETKLYLKEWIFNDTNGYEERTTVLDLKGS